ncbi:MAG: TetR/AcrR family transcriptional regulator [Spirochaetia bacterium]|nr:TetR/AcrR family transcriptional regulator [Spirochaetia bacterium]
MPGFRETKKQRRRDRIYDAAIALLSEKGFNSTHMRDISKRAELAVGTLYNYYASKSELYMEIMEEKWKEISYTHTRRIVRLVCKEEDLFTILKGILWPIFQDMLAMGMDDWGEVFMAVFSSKKFMARGASMDMEAIDGLQTILDKLQKRGLIQQSAHPRTVATTIYSIVAFNFLSILFIEGMDKKYFFQSTENQLQLIIDGLEVRKEKEGQ